MKCPHFPGWLKVGDPYSTNSGDDFVTAAHKEMREILSKAEVPGWRERFLSPTYHTEARLATSKEFSVQVYLKIRFWIKFT